MTYEFCGEVFMETVANFVRTCHGNENTDVT